MLLTLIYTRLTNIMESGPIHVNPAASKIKRARHASDARLYPLATKQNNSSINIENSFSNQCEHHCQEQNNTLSVKGSANQKSGLKEISINISSTKQPLKTLSKLINFDSQSLNKSYSLSQLGERDNRCVGLVKKWNQSLRKQVQDTEKRISQLSSKKAKLQLKYQRLKQTQCSKLQIRVKKLSLNSSIPPSAGQLESNYQSFLQTSQNNMPKSHDSRCKLSEIRQRISGLDVSNISKFAKGSIIHCS